MATSASCPYCEGRNWTVYITGNQLELRCGDCDMEICTAALLDETGRIIET